jgi:hypothetical protein
MLSEGMTPRGDDRREVIILHYLVLEHLETDDLVRLARVQVSEGQEVVAVRVEVARGR